MFLPKSSRGPFLLHSSKLFHWKNSVKIRHMVKPVNCANDEDSDPFIYHCKKLRNENEACHVRILAQGLIFYRHCPRCEEKVFTS